MLTKFWSCLTKFAWYTKCEMRQTSTEAMLIIILCNYKLWNVVLGFTWNICSLLIDEYHKWYWHLFEHKHKITSFESVLQISIVKRFDRWVFQLICVVSALHRNNWELDFTMFQSKLNTVEIEFRNSLEKISIIAYEDVWTVKLRCLFNMFKLETFMHWN